MLVKKSHHRRLEAAAEADESLGELDLGRVAAFGIRLVAQPAAQRGQVAMVTERWLAQAHLPDHRQRVRASRRPSLLHVMEHQPAREYQTWDLRAYGSQSLDGSRRVSRSCLLVAAVFASATTADAASQGPIAAVEYLYGTYTPKQHCIEVGQDLVWSGEYSSTVVVMQASRAGGGFSSHLTTLPIPLAKFPSSMGGGRRPDRRVNYRVFDHEDMRPHYPCNQPVDVRFALSGGRKSHEGRPA